MNLTELCDRIQLQKEIQAEVVDYYQKTDFTSARPLLEKLKDLKTEAQARAKLALRLEPDLRKIKMLTHMLVCAAEIYPWYQEKGIPDRVFYDTMGCFPRFMEECRQITGAYAFDREWWTARQVSGNLFRIGELEYEMRPAEPAPAVHIHIPSDAVLTAERCCVSFKAAKSFFEAYFPAYGAKEYVCRSWLLAPELAGLLPPDSNILAFQRQFAIEKADYQDTEYIRWIFKTGSMSPMDFPEHTTLQRNLKRHLMDGGKLGRGWGVLVC